MSDHKVARLGGKTLLEYASTPAFDRLASEGRSGMLHTIPSGRHPGSAELMPMISMASICSVTRIVPISEAMLEPTLPARISDIIVQENSSMTISRVASPVAYAGIIGDSMLIFIWMQITAPMKIEMIVTKGIESTPSL